MNLGQRTLTVSEYRKLVNFLLYYGAVLTTALLIAIVGWYSKNEIVTQQVPGMPSEAVFEKTAMDKKSQMAFLTAFTSAMGSINPSNANYIKPFLQVFLDATAYTAISKAIDAQVAKMAAERELGSRYFIFKRYLYDDVKNRHFVIGDIHIVNAAKDSAEPFVFEYAINIENYRLVIKSYEFYQGDIPRTAEVEKVKAKAQGK